MYIVFVYICVLSVLWKCHTKRTLNRRLPRASASTNNSNDNDIMTVSACDIRVSNTEVASEGSLPVAKEVV